MFKNKVFLTVPVLLAVLAFLIWYASGGMTTHAAAIITQQYTGNHNGPYEVEVRNSNPGSAAMTESRVVNDALCANDLGVVSSNYNADSSILANEAFLVAESTCDGMLLKSNGDNYIDFSVGLAPTRKMRIRHDGSIGIMPSSKCGTVLPDTGVFLCVNLAGELNIVKSDG